MLLELFPFVALNNAMGHDGFYILISFSLLTITVRGVSNKHCLLPFFIGVRISVMFHLMFVHIIFSLV